MKSNFNPAREALTRAVNRAIADGAPVYVNQPTNMTTALLVTVDRDSRGQIILRDETGVVLATRSRYCNPAAIHQIILDAEMLGAEIDWDNSQCAQPL